MRNRSPSLRTNCRMSSIPVPSQGRSWTMRRSPVARASFIRMVTPVMDSTRCPSLRSSVQGPRKSCFVLPT